MSRKTEIRIPQEPASAAVVELGDFGHRIGLGLSWGEGESRVRIVVELTPAALQVLEMSARAATRSLLNGNGYRAERDVKAGEK